MEKWEELTEQLEWAWTEMHYAFADRILEEIEVIKQETNRLNKMNIDKIKNGGWFKPDFYYAGVNFRI